MSGGDQSVMSTGRWCVCDSNNVNSGRLDELEFGLRKGRRILSNESVELTRHRWITEE